MGHAAQKVTTARSLAQFIGKHGTLVTAAEKLAVGVTIKDARICFGRTDLFCVADGNAEEGGAWVASDRVALTKDAR